MALYIEVDFYEMTWAELRAFVKAGKHMPDAEAVLFATDPHGEECGLRVLGDVG